MVISPNALNIVDITVANLTIVGNLTFDGLDSNTQISIKSKGINIFGGSFVLGSPDAPFLGKAVIELQGLHEDRTPFLYDDITDVGNKVIGVTGVFSLYGNPTPNSWNRLTNFNTATPNVITVQDATGWAIGDTLVVSPSATSASEWETATIANINGKVITLSKNLEKWHYGASGPAVTRTFTDFRGQSVDQTLDMRAIVGKLNRNIVIRGS